jgi:hypothetical protein
MDFRNVRSSFHSIWLDRDILQSVLQQDQIGVDGIESSYVISNQESNRSSENNQNQYLMDLPYPTISGDFD